ncbi:hypothetical protein Daus18300_009640 [Diaporthe australafricana]|uniref:Phytanoyl-CoA dioxygenase family protein n=1 Tax=Diaporthe australafricana TaxID=127596 RepID=A0ABR3WDG2_9PEZI
MAAAAAASAANKVIRNGPSPARGPLRRLFSLNEAPSVDQLAAICSQRATREHYPLAAAVESNVPIYDLPAFSALPKAQRGALQDEWYHILHSGPGVFVTKGLFRDRQLLERANRAFYSIIEREREGGVSQGDHFAAAGKNDRIWNSFSKHALADPASFAAYYGNPFLGLVSSAWLGGGYRVTAQVNNVKPGSKAQVCHRDYHLGFQTAEGAAQVPRAMHAASALLTLQGAVAHVDVPPESGPTRLLPFSQTFEGGYMAYRRQEFVDYFQDHYVALPMDAGDGIFFSPALFHAAGENVSQDVNRMANLLQVSSPFGKPMESVDALPLLDACWDEIVARHGREGMSDEVQALLCAICEGYAFPTNLDNNPPRPGGLAPVSELDVAVQGLEEGWSREKLVDEFKAHQSRSRP